MYGDVIRLRAEIPSEDFLPIFLSSSLVLVFGVLFVAIFTAVTVEMIKKYYIILAYFFWVLQTYSIYFMTEKIHSEPFTQKILIVTMFAYLWLPHLYYYLNQKAHEKYEK